MPPPDARARRTAARLALLAASLGPLAAPPPAVAGEAAASAIRQVRELRAAGRIAPGTVLRLRVKQGNMASFLGRDNELQREWEAATGVPVDASAMPQADSLDYVRTAADVDLTVARNHEYPDLVDQGLIEDLTPYYRRFGFALPGAAGSAVLAARAQAWQDGRVVAVPADGDVALLFLRRDLLEDEANRRAFRERHGRPLAPPATWQEYLDLVAFFHRPQAGFFGALEPREKTTGWFYWIPRFAAFAGPDGALFDARMRPRIDSPAGVAATESYVATVALSPPEILGDGKDYSYTVPIFLRGNGFATIVTPALAKIANRAGSAVRDRFAAVPMPGHRHGGKIHRQTHFIYGNNLVVPVRSPNKELAFLYAQWFTDPEVSARSVGVAVGFQDPFLVGHLDDPALREIYGAATLDRIRGDAPGALPSGTGLPGDSEYLAALNEQLWAAAAGRIDAREAMRRAARQWEEITERRGRARQIAAWSALRADQARR